MNEDVIGIIDTGSSFITIPENTYDEILSVKFNEDNYCEDVDTIFPVISYQINSIFY